MESRKHFILCRIPGGREPESSHFRLVAQVATRFSATEVL